MFLLDTNVLSELRKAPFGRAHPRVTAWASGVAPEATFISAITLMEVEVGARRIERRDPAQGTVLRRWIDTHVRQELASHTIPVDSAVALRAAMLHVPDPQPPEDALIAATALVHGLTVVTRNVADFAPMGVPVLNPWDP